MVKIIVDRKLGTYHPKHKDLYYPVNYGYIEGIFAGDGEEQDVYILGVEEAVEEFEGEIIAIIHRKNDVEDKWVAAPRGMCFSKEEIKKLTDFQERYFKSEVELIPYQRKGEQYTMAKTTDYLEKYYKENNLNCAEAVFCAALEAWGVEMPKETVKAMAGFGGGMGSGNVCGAVTGGVAALSCAFVEGVGGHTSSKLMDKVRRFLAEVKTDFGSELCSELKPQYFTPEERCYQTTCKIAEVLDRVHDGA